MQTLPYKQYKQIFQGIDITRCGLVFKVFLNLVPQLVGLLLALLIVHHSASYY